MLVGYSNSNNNKETEVSKSIIIEKQDTDLEVNENEIITTIKDIAQEPSVLGTEEEKNKAEYLKNKMESYGYIVKYQDFEVFDLGKEVRALFTDSSLEVFLNINPINSTKSKGVARNVIVQSKNHDSNKKTLYVFSHYDTTKRTTGVYDNATGVSAVSEIARVLQNKNYKDFNVTYVFFSAEEYFRMGSRYFISQLSELERSNILGAINIDMVGYTGFNIKSPIGEDLPEVGAVEINLNNWIKKDALETIFNEKFNNKYTVHNEAGVSDDISFARLNIPTIYFADKNSFTGFEIEEENFETQLSPVNSSSIADLTKDISDFIKSFNINRFNDLNSISDEEKGVYENK